MHRPVLILIALAALAGAIGARVAAQATPPPAAPPPGAPQAATPPPAGGGGRGQGRAGGDSFPAQQRPPGDPAVIARGKLIFDVACASCHGGDLRGGQLNGPNLLRSQLVLNDQEGELILPIVQGSRADKGMPALPIPPDDVKAIAVYIHSVTASSRGQGSPPRGMGPPPDVLVGDAAAGATYFGSDVQQVPFADRRPAGRSARAFRTPSHSRTSGSPAGASADAAVAPAAARKVAAPRRRRARSPPRSRSPATRSSKAGYCATTTFSSPWRWLMAPFAVSAATATRRRSSSSIRSRSTARCCRRSPTKTCAT